MLVSLGLQQLCSSCEFVHRQLFLKLSLIKACVMLHLWLFTEQQCELWVMRTGTLCWQHLTAGNQLVSLGMQQLCSSCEFVHGQLFLKLGWIKACVMVHLWHFTARRCMSVIAAANQLFDGSTLASQLGPATVAERLCSFYEVQLQ
jgi:hypothetical protein